MIHAPGLTPAAVFEKLATIQMVEVWIPMLDGGWIVLPRHTQPEKDVQVLFEQTRITLPSQPPAESNLHNYLLRPRNRHPARLICGEDLLVSSRRSC
jgi:hypothetical protein